MSNRNLFSELKRRNVYKVAITYAVVAWLVIQAASILLPTFEAPGWVMKALVVFLAFGFFFVVMISWAFEATPEGLKRTEDVPEDVAAKLPTWSQRKFAAFITFVAVLATGLLVYQFLRPNKSKVGAATADSGIPSKSIAVLPFDSLSEDKTNAYFAEGVQDEILTRLARVADLKVISRTSTQRFKSAPPDLREIAKQLGVMNVLEGSVQRADDRVRVNVQLINAMNDAHLWAETYDRKLIDIFSVESEIAKAIADTLQAKLSAPEKTMMAKTPAANPEAYELYLRGRFFWNKRTAADLRKSIEYFNQAIAKDPNCAQSYAALAQSYATLSAYNGASPADSCPQAEAAANKALEIDNTCSDAVDVLASVKALYRFDLAGALTDYERAIELNPNDATAHHWLATDVLASTGQRERELVEMQRAVELDPLSLIIRTNLANAYMHNGRLDDAIAEFRKVIELDENFYAAQKDYGVALERQGKTMEAIAHYEKAAAISDDPVALGVLGRGYAISGQPQKADEILDRLRRSRKEQYTPAYALALVSLGLGDRTRALIWLEESYRERDGNTIGQIRIDPLLGGLDGNPAFEALAEKIVPASQFQSAKAVK
jgi:TolB-like protein/Flp pilus assembly protein TadD